MEFVLLVSIFPFLIGKSPQVPILMQSYIIVPALLPVLELFRGKWSVFIADLSVLSSWHTHATEPSSDVWLLFNLMPEGTHILITLQKIFFQCMVLVILNSLIFLHPLAIAISPHNSSILTVTIEISKCSTWVLFCASLSLPCLFSMILIL